MRRETDAMLMSNSTLMVQAFFLMSAFLLANKLLQQRRRQQRIAFFSTFAETMVNRVVRSVKQQTTNKKSILVVQATAQRLDIFLYLCKDQGQPYH